MNINAYLLALALLLRSLWAALLASATHWTSESRLHQTQVNKVLSSEKTNSFLLSESWQQLAYHVGTACVRLWSEFWWHFCVRCQPSLRMKSCNCLKMKTVKDSKALNFGFYQSISIDFYSKCRTPLRHCPKTLRLKIIHRTKHTASKRNTET